MKKIIFLLFAIFCLSFCVPSASAAQAEDISGRELVTGHAGLSSVNMLFDGRSMEALKIRQGGHLTLTHEDGIGSLYIVFGQEYGPYTVTDGERVCIFGENGFLHEFLDLEGAFGYVPRQVTLDFEHGDCLLAEISAFTSGNTPDWVQKWAPPLEGESDLALFSTHGDDEQLFFAGILPWYSSEMGYNVQVVYLTGHRNMTVRRSHEMLDGLWAVGIRNYPVFGPFGDYNSNSAEEAYSIYRNKGITREDLLSFVVENVRRFRPKVAVGHDLKGEYGHGMHMIYAQLLCQAVELSHDPAQFPESAEQFGIWDVPKTYLHLYPEQPIRMDWDIPMECFEGMTAFEVTRDLGFPCHTSQQSYYSWYFSGMNLASEIPEYSPCDYGLYRSTVGEDVQKNDFFENLTTHGQDALLAAKLQLAEKESLKPSKPEVPEDTAIMQPDITEPPEATGEPVPSAFSSKIWIIVIFVGIGLLFGIKKFCKKF